MKAGTAQLELEGVKGYFQHSSRSHWAQNMASKIAALLGVGTGSRWEQSHAPVGETLTQGQRVEAQPLTRGGVLTPFPLWQQAA